MQVILPFDADPYKCINIVQQLATNVAALAWRTIKTFVGREEANECNHFIITFNMSHLSQNRIKENKKKRTRKT
jgi:hypothetical protein